MRRCIQQIVKEERQILKLSLFRYHQELRKELGKGWNHSLGPELEGRIVYKG